MTQRARVYARLPCVIGPQPRYMLARLARLVPLAPTSSRRTNRTLVETDRLLFIRCRRCSSGRPCANDGPASCVRLVRFWNIPTLPTSDWSVV
eukprot:1183127-Prorocentrum_minimum.AAC.1